MFVSYENRGDVRVKHMTDGIDGAITSYLPILRQHAEEAHNGFVIELGSGIGTGSTGALVEGLSKRNDPLMISVDIKDYMVEKPTVPWWHLVIGDSKDFTTRDLVGAISDWDCPSLIFVDTEHSYDQMKQELKVWGPLANSRTVWLFHDVYMGGMRNPMLDAILEYAHLHHWVYEDLDTGAHGLGRMRRA